MFHVTCFGWLIFRAQSAARSSISLGALRSTSCHPPLRCRALLIPFALIVGPLMIVHSYQARRGSESAPLSLARPVRYALYGAVFYLVLLFGSFEGAQFIYFQF